MWRRQTIDISISKCFCPLFNLNAKIHKQSEKINIPGVKLNLSKESTIFSDFTTDSSNFFESIVLSVPLQCFVSFNNANAVKYSLVWGYVIGFEIMKTITFHENGSWDFITG